MECEMCGAKVATRRYMVDRTLMQLGIECSRYGTALDTPQPAPAGTQAAIQQGLERRAERMVSRNVFSEQETMVLVTDFGARIHKARDAKGLSHEQLGNKVSARVPELKHIESGKLRPGDNLVKKLEKELGIVLLEKVEPVAPVGAAAKATASGPITIGDLLRDAAAAKKK